MPIYKARGRQDERQGRRIPSTNNPRYASRDQYGHRLYSVMGVGSRVFIGLNNRRVYADGIERFKGTAKACIEYCKSHRYLDLVIVALYAR